MTSDLGSKMGRKMKEKVQVGMKPESSKVLAKCDKYTSHHAMHNKLFHCISTLHSFTFIPLEEVKNIQYT
jgi:hypothetical protein